MISVLFSLFLMIAPTGSFATECERWVEDAPSIAPDDRLTQLAKQIFRRAILYDAYSRLEDFNGWIPDFYHEYFGESRSIAPVVSIKETLSGEKMTSARMVALQKWLRTSRMDAYALGEREFSRSVFAAVSAVGSRRQYESRANFRRNEAVVGIDVADADGDVRHFALRFAYTNQDDELLFERSLSTGIPPVINEVDSAAQWADGYSSFVNHQVVPIRPVFQLQGESEILPFDEVIIASLPKRTEAYSPMIANFYLMKQGRSISGNPVEFERANSDDLVLRFASIKGGRNWRSGGYVFTLNLANNTLSVRERSGYPLIGGRGRGRPIVFKKID